MQIPTSSTQTIATETLGPFSERDMLSYLKASRDDNLVHRDDQVAAAAGFVGRPMPGMMLMAQLERLIDSLRQRQRVTRFACRFLNPIYIGTTMIVTARAISYHNDGSIEELLITVLADGKEALLGQAKLTPAGLKIETF